MKKKNLATSKTWNNLEKRFKAFQRIIKKRIFHFYITVEDIFLYSSLSVIKPIHQITKFLQNGIQRNLVLFEKIQFTLIYLFGCFDLIFTTLNQVHMLGSFPTIFSPFLALTHYIFHSFLAQIWGSPERVFFVSFWVLKVLVISPTSKVSKLAKFHILLVFSIMMTQNLVLSTFDFLLNRDVIPSITDSFMNNTFSYMNRSIMSFLFLLIFTLYSIFLLLCYIQAINHRVVKITGFDWLTDSVAFWVKIKTPTMKDSIFFK